MGRICLLILGGLCCTCEAGLLINPAPGRFEAYSSEFCLGGVGFCQRVCVWPKWSNRWVPAAWLSIASTLAGLCEQGSVSLVKVCEA